MKIYIFFSFFLMSCGNSTPKMFQSNIAVTFDASEETCSSDSQEFSANNMVISLPPNTFNATCFRTKLISDAFIPSKLTSSDIKITGQGSYMFLSTGEGKILSKNKNITSCIYIDYPLQSSTNENDSWSKLSFEDVYSNIDLMITKIENKGEVNLDSSDMGISDSTSKKIESSNSVTYIHGDTSGDLVFSQDSSEKIKICFNSPFSSAQWIAYIVNQNRTSEEIANTSDSSSITFDKNQGLSYSFGDESKISYDNETLVIDPEAGTITTNPVDNSKSEEDDNAQLNKAVFSLDSDRRYYQTNEIINITITISSLKGKYRVINETTGKVLIEDEKPNNVESASVIYKIKPEFKTFFTYGKNVLRTEFTDQEDNFSQIYVDLYLEDFTIMSTEAFRMFPANSDSGSVGSFTNWTSPLGNQNISTGTFHLSVSLGATIR